MPLTAEEIDELDQFLTSSTTSDETMTIDALDGYLTAIVIGPVTLSFDQWFSRIWGPNKEDMPQFKNREEAQHIINLIIRHMNGMIAVLEHDPDAIDPLFEYVVLGEEDKQEYIDGEMWAHGFITGVDLCKADWSPLIENLEGKKKFIPIWLLGADEITAEEMKLVDTIEKREALTGLIPESIVWIYRFWQPYRLAMLERTVAKNARRDGVKVGRNDPCPCGSGKKFKKCCGVVTLH